MHPAMHHIRYNMLRLTIAIMLLAILITATIGLCLLYKDIADRPGQDPVTGEWKNSRSYHDERLDILETRIAVLENSEKEKP